MGQSVTLLLPVSSVVIVLPESTGASGFTYEQSGRLYNEAPLTYEGQVPAISATIVVAQEA